MDRCILPFLLSTLLCTTYSVHADNIKCWMNDEGIRECGNTVPQKYSQQGHQEFNEEAIKVKEIAPAKSATEIAEEVRKEEEVRKRKEQETLDRRLLDLFSKEEDIESARQAILSTIEGQVSSIQTIIESLKANLNDIEENYQLAEGNKDVTESQRETIRNNIRNAKQRIKDNEKTLEEKLQEKMEVNRKHDEYMAHFRKIKEKGMGYITTLKEKPPEDKEQGKTTPATPPAEQPAKE
ncbi:MAG: hypothetical protein BWK79_05960 [Beggiatoa sp. IS2]|nr:MAG: hypothetical protein BWK79_05960 [Beggiatoa sp. IS2]